MSGSRSAEARLTAGPNPFVGPRPFERGEPLFGRGRELSELHYRLNAERIVLLHSPSGAGKSSLVQAGLLPLVARSFDVLGPTRVHLETAAGIAGANRYGLSAISGFEEGVPPALRRPVEALAGQSLADYLAHRPRRRAAPPNALVIFDQFEEVLTADPLAVEARQAFFDQLGELLRNPSVWALFALREDYLAPLDPYRDRVPTHLQNRFRIELLGRDAAREAMVEPARAAGREFEAVDALIADLATVKVQQADGTFVEEAGRYVEPVQLQVVCRRLWDAMPSASLAIATEDLERFGDVDEALGAYYADSVARIAAGDPGRERAIRDWFGEELITAGGLRGQVLREAKASGGLANEQIDRLRGTHLIRAEQRAGATWYELAHDRLIEPVRRDNAAWQQTNLAEAQRRAALWERQGRPAGLLLAGAELAAAEGWAAAGAARVTEAEKAFLADSRRAQAIALRERRQARAIRGLAVAAVAVAVLAAWQWWEANKQTALAVQAQGEAERQKSVAEAQTAALKVKEGELGGALGMATKAEQEAKRRQAEAEEATETERSARAVAFTREPGREVEALSMALRAAARGIESAGNPPRPALIEGLAAAVQAARSSLPLRGHGDEVVAAAFSPDGTRLLTQGKAGEERLWDTADGRFLAAYPGGRPFRPMPVSGASFSSDGKRFVTSHKQVEIRDARTGALLRSLAGHKGKVVGALFSPGSKEILSSGEDGTLRIWNALDGETLHVLAAPPGQTWGAVYAVQYSSDGARIFSLHQDHQFRIWDAKTGRLLRVGPEGSDAEVKRFLDGTAIALPPGSAIGYRLAELSPDGAQATGWNNHFPTLQDARTGEAIQPVYGHFGEENEGHSGDIVHTGFSPDGRFLVTASRDDTARIWNAHYGNLIAVLQGHSGSVLYAAFSPEGRRVVTASQDGTARLWDLRGDRSLATLGEQAPALGRTDAEKIVHAAAFSPDGATVATGHEDGSLRLWNARRGKLLAALKTSGPVLSVAFSADGSRLVGSGKTATTLWDVAARRTLVTVEGNGEALRQQDNPSANFSRRGDRLLAVTAKEWIVLDSRTGKVLGRRPSEGRGVVVFSPLGRQIALVEFGNVGLRNLDTGKDFLLARNGRANFAVFSPDGSRLVTPPSPGGEPPVPDDATVQIWDTRTGKLLRTLQEHGGEAGSAAFSPDGARLVTTGGAVRIWDAETGKTLAILDHAAGVQHAMFSPDGSQVLTVGEAGAALWDAQTGHRLAGLRGPVGDVYSAVFSRDGRRIVTASQDGCAKIYSAVRSDLVEEYLTTAFRLLRQQPRGLEGLRPLEARLGPYLHSLRGGGLHR